jgi:MFS family permease
VQMNISFYRTLAKNTTFWIISLSHLLTHVFDLMNVSLIPTFTDEFSITLVQAGLLVTLPLLASIASSLLSGIVMSKFSLKPLMIVSLSLMGVAALLVSITPNFLMLVVYLSLLTFGSRLYCPPALSIVSESCEDCERNRGKTVGFHVSIVMVGIAFGPIGLGFLTLYADWRLAYLLWAIPLFVSAVAVAKMNLDLLTEREAPELMEGDDTSCNLSSVVTTGFIVLLIALGFRSMGVQGISTFMTTYFVAEKDLSQSLASILFGAGRAVGILGVSVGGALSDTLGKRRWITITWTASLVSLLAFSQAPSMPLLILFFVLYQSFNSSSTAPVMSLVASFTSKRRRGLGYMLYFFSSSVMGAFAPIMTAQIITVFGVGYIFPFVLIVLGAAILLIQQSG